MTDNTNELKLEDNIIDNKDKKEIIKKKPIEEKKK